MNEEEEELKKSLRWLYIRDAFEGQSTPDCYLIGHALMGVSGVVGDSSKNVFIANEGWTDFSRFCDMCDVVASLRNQGIDRMSCLSLWQTYEVNI
ncbi:hypothetical protein LCGC14_2490460 [marine sediment metagenome]|uniref:Uncharacterized protein n=1 Tax=marine sediment metagenome TaxID=412755 RepID=A0A0F9DGR0_9ZZZZ